MTPEQLKQHLTDWLDSRCPHGIQSGERTIKANFRGSWTWGLSLVAAKPGEVPETEVGQRRADVLKTADSIVASVRSPECSSLTVGVLPRETFAFTVTGGFSGDTDPLARPFSDHVS